MKYRAEIDGLRALAVLAVVFYHAKIGAMAGGFLGVDVFFVISGFLITKNILSEQAQGQFRLIDFYERRARRILPILFLVLFVSGYFAWRYLLPSDLVEYSSSVLSTLGFVSNVFFYFQDSYHAAESATKPLLHTWSLGVEEQFYLLFPLLLILASKQSLVRRFWVLGLIFLASLCFAQYAAGRYSEFNFYLLPSRLWELLAGAMLAVYTAIRPVGGGVKVSALMSLAGLLLIVSALLLFNSAVPHPSALTLVPILGTVAVIAWGANCSVTSFLLGNPLMAWVGRLSYSIYLWHFPVFAYAHIKSNEVAIQPSEAAKLLLLTLLLSVIGHYLVEKPFRNRQRWSTKSVMLVLASSAIVLGVWAAYTIKHDGVEKRLGDIESIFAGADREDSFLRKNGRRCFFRPRNLNSCRFDEFGAAAPRLINIGDSHSNMISVPLYEYAREHGFNFYNMILSHCPFIEDAWRRTGFKTQCETSDMDVVRDYLRRIPPSIIVYTARWPMYLNPDEFDNGEGGKENSLYLPFRPSPESRARGEETADLIIRTFDALSSLGHTVVLVYPTPEVGWHVPKLIKERLDKVSARPVGRKRKAFEKMSVTTSYEVYKKRTESSRAILDQVTGSNVLRVYPDKMLCSELTGRCATHDQEHIFYYDDDHLSQIGASMLVAEIAEVIESVRAK